MLDHIESNNLLADCQWGFREGRSTCSALMDISHTWFKSLDRGEELVVVFFDYCKAFDSVPHSSLLNCLLQLGFSQHIVSWLSSYLNSRKQQVNVNGSVSSSVDVISGVPQGSVLGPILFTLYINGVTEIKLSDNTFLTLFADDMSLTKIIHTDNDILELQADINSIYSWSQSRYLTLNENKCKFMVLSRKHSSMLVNSPPSFWLGNVKLEQVHHYKYLGVFISDDLKWGQHINNVCKKARQMVGLIYRNLYSASSDCLLRLYKSLISTVV